MPTSSTCFILLHCGLGASTRDMQKWVMSSMNHILKGLTINNLAFLWNIKLIKCFNVPSNNLAHRMLFSWTHSNWLSLEVWNVNCDKREHQSKLWKLLRREIWNWEPIRIFLLLEFPCLAVSELRELLKKHSTLYQSHC